MDQQTAYQHHCAGRYADAAAIYQSLLNQNPDNVAVLHLFGVLHQQSGYPERSVELIGRAISLRADVAMFHANQGESYRSLKQYDRAAECCRTALLLQPHYPEVVHNLGLVLHEQGRDAEAVEMFDLAINQRPDFANAHNSCGTSLRALRKSAEALDAFRTAVRLDPQLALARANLGQMLVDQDDAAEGLAQCQEAVRLQPDLPAAHNNLGNALRALKRWDSARVAYTEAIRLDPSLAVAHASLGLTLQFEGEMERALPYFYRATELSPDEPLVFQHLAFALAVAEDWESAVPCCEQWVRLVPQSADAHCELGWSYQSAELPVQAAAAYRRAIDLQPDHRDAWLNLGMLQEEQGALAEAEATYRQAEVLIPDSPMPLACRAALVRGRLSDAERDRLRFQLYGPLSQLPRMQCLFALAQVADARGDYAEAAACLAPANEFAQQRRRNVGQFYDRDKHSRYVDRLIGSFSSDLFARLGDVGDESRQPIFVFGMPRSGTTLVEHVLASHPQVHGAGELLLARRALESLPVVSQKSADLAECLAALDPPGVWRLAQSYQAGVRKLLDRQKFDATPMRVVDKLPDNYLYLGLIALMFPKATLIHLRRDIRDVAVSCWLTRFRSIRWADTQEDLARRCQDYHRLMEYWKSVIPGTIHEVRYEDLVNNFEHEARRLVAASGLNWDPACLQFHQTERPVRTASVTQVRQPVYRKSLARWKSYEPYLSSLFEQLPDV